MSIPKDCMSCKNQNHCNSAMYCKGCHYFPPEVKKERPFKQFFGKFFK